MDPLLAPPAAACVLHSDPWGRTFDPYLLCPRLWTACLCLGVFMGRKRASAADMKRLIRTHIPVPDWAGLLYIAFESQLFRCAFNLPRKKKKKESSGTIPFFPCFLPSSTSFILFFCTVCGSSVESTETKHTNFSTSTTQSFRLEATVTGLQVNIHCVNILLFPILQIYYL